MKFFLFAILSVSVCNLVRGQTLEEIFGKASGTSNTTVFSLDPYTLGEETFDSTTSQPKLPVSSGSEKSSRDVGDCVCVPYYRCNNNSLRTNGETIIDISMQKSRCSGSILNICCKKKDIDREPITPAPPLNPPPSGCGYRQPNGVGIKIKGLREKESQIGEFPWMVAILKDQIELNIYQCGGALIHPNAVLTAAHCVMGKGNRIKLRAGEWDTQYTDELYPHQERDVESVIIHPHYYDAGKYNDVALLFFKSPFNITRNVQVICLPKPNLVTSNSRCYATGWGIDASDNKYEYQAILKKIELPIVENNDCQERLRSTRVGKYFGLHRSFICAGGEPKQDTCKGDGGSPLVCPIPGQKDRFYQAGIVSWGMDCGENNIPGVYANVAAFRDWIDDQMRNQNLDIAFYQY